MMATKVASYGRGKAPLRSNRVDPHGLQAASTDEATKPSQVVVLGASEWQRMTGKSISDREYASYKEAQIQKRREALHEMSKDRVKHWENTIAGQRQKRLHARQLRLEQEEKEALERDQREAAFQAEERRRAIDRAKTVLYYETDRVRQLHSALMVSEMLREREAQLEYKAQHQDLKKKIDAKIIQHQEEEREKATIADLKVAKERLERRMSLSQFHTKQAAEKEQKKLQERLEHLEEQRKLDKEGEEFQMKKLELAKECWKEKARQRQELDAVLQEKLKKEEEDVRQEEVEGERLKIFTKAKRHMDKLRKEKEEELSRKFREHQQRMSDLLLGQMQQASSDEDQRIAKAIKEQEAKREAQEREKEERFKAATRDIQKHMLEQMTKLEQDRNDRERMDKEMLKQRIVQDQKFHSKQMDKLIKAKQDAKDLQQFHSSQTKEIKARKKAEAEEGISYNRKNKELLQVEEAQFQQYASKLTSEVKARGAPIRPLQETAKKPAGGGHGPVLSDYAVCPSYLVNDSTDVELPSYGSHQVPKNTQKRMGFIW